MHYIPTWTEPQINFYIFQDKSIADKKILMDDTRLEHQGFYKELCINGCFCIFSLFNLSVFF